MPDGRETELEYVIDHESGPLGKYGEISALVPTLPPLSARLAEVVRAYLPVSLLSFGGGQAGIAMYFDYFVKRKKWLTENEFLEWSNSFPVRATLKSLTQSPMVRSGVLCGIVAFFVLCLPCMVVLIAAGYAIGSTGGTLPIWLEYLNNSFCSVAVGMVVSAGVTMAGKAASSNLTAGIATVEFVAVVLAPRIPYIYAVLILGGGLTTLFADCLVRWAERRRHLPQHRFVVWVARTLGQTVAERREDKNDGKAENGTVHHPHEGTNGDGGAGLDSSAVGYLSPSHDIPDGVTVRDGRDSVGTSLRVADRARRRAELSEFADTGDGDSVVDRVDSDTGRQVMSTPPPPPPPTRPFVSPTHKAPTSQIRFVTLPPRLGLLLIFVWPFCLVVSILVTNLLPNRNLVLDVASISLLTGSLAYGGGGALITILQPLSTSGLITNAQFLVGFSLIQVLPGPNLTLAGYFGTVAFRQGGLPGVAFLGGLLGFAVAFLPGLSLATGVFSFWEKVREYAWVKSCMVGVKAAGVAQVFAGAYFLGTSCILGRDNGPSVADYPLYLSLCVGAFVLVHKYGVSTVVAILCGGVVGVIEWLARR